MSRIAAVLPVPPRMYRHFAVVTVLLTLCVAIFADGSRRQAISDEIDAQKQKAEMRAAEGDQRKERQIKAGVHHYPSGQAGAAAGAVEPAPMVNPQGEGGGVMGDNGQVRQVQSYDQGRFGPPGLQQAIAGQKGGETTVPLVQPGTGERPGRKQPTANERAALERSAMLSAGAPSRPNH